MTEETLFERARQLVGNERVAFLDRECPDPVLRARVEALLAADAASYSPLDGPVDGTRSFGDPEATGTFRPASSPEEAEGTIIAGRYKLRQQIGEGGMGTVWMADQTEPVKRKVAVKLIRVDRGQSKTILARFEAERQAIALMDHPHIAKLLDAGTTETGSPFFVMELVKGVPLNDFCDQHRLTIQDRLNLFQQICSAVQHAHQKGIIHRDLKPSNILVESHDGKPVPKVIDFGLAKATTGLQLSEQSLFTAFGSVMGTPLYMAPEQASFNAVDVDTRADVYALGVILYELLTGTTPINRDTLKKVALDEMLKLIREQEAPTPSSRLSSSDNAPSVAANRQIEPVKLGRFVKGELDWIVMKALSKDRDRRYETANGFAKDIERFLAHEPVQAGPPSARYRFKKFVQRNRGQVIAASLVLFALLAGIAGTSLGLLEARRQQEIAEKSADQERTAKEREAERADGERLAKLDAHEKEKLAVAARKEAVDMAEQSQAISDFLQFDLLRQADVNAQADANFEPNRDLTIRVALDRAALNVGKKFANRPHIEAAIRLSIGHSYISVAEFDKAIVHLKRASELAQVHFGPRSQRTQTIDHYLGEALLYQGRHTEAIPILERTLAASEKLLGADHPETLVSRSELALVYKQTGDLIRAIPLYEQTLHAADKAASLGPFHGDTLTYANNLASAYATARRFDEAVVLAARVLEGRRKVQSDQHPLTEQARSNLGGMYVEMRRYDLARPLLEQSFAQNLKLRGPDHPETLVTQSHLADCLRDHGETAEARKHYETILAAKSATPDLKLLLAVRVDLASVHRSAGRPDLAVPYLRQAVGQAGTLYGPQSTFTRVYTQHLAGTLQQLQDYDESERLFRGLVELSREKDGPNSVRYGSELAYLGNNLLCQRKWSKAESVLLESREIYSRLATEHWFYFHIQSALGGALLGQKKYADAEPLLLKGYEGMKAREKTIPPQGSTRIPEALDRLIELYTATNKPDEVKKYRDLRATYPPELAPMPREEK